ncbi:gluconokinase [Deminuibacter soli]|nr:gluconokinase [Deminuibacter soli]
MAHIIAIDIGTTNCKAVTVNTKGEIYHTCKMGYPIIQETRGQSEQDPDLIFQSVLTMLHEALGASDGREVLAISFSAAMHSVIAVDATGKPLTRSITWADTRSERRANELLQRPDAADIFSHTGTPIHPMSPLSKLIWLREEQPDVFAQTHKFISIKEYVFYKLFGRYVVDYSIASATGLFDAETSQWYAPALAAAGIRADQLSTPMNCTHSETGLLPGIARILPAAQNLPFVLGASDGTLANLGCGAVAPGEAALTIGTSGAVRVISANAPADAHARLFRYILTDKLFVTGGPTNNGGIALQWIAQKVLQLPLQSDEDFERLWQVAATVPPGADKLLFLPYLLGERAPVWDAGAKGVFLGLTTRHQPPHLLRAVMEGILFALQQVLQTVEANTGTVNRIYASGGFTHSAFWLQLLADITGKTIIRTDGADASAIGAAMLAMYARGIIQNPLDVKHLVQHLSTIEPNPATHATYQAYFNIYEGLYPALKQSFTQLNNL